MPAEADAGRDQRDDAPEPSSASSEGTVAGRDTVLGAVAYAAERFLRAERWDEVIDDVLRCLGQATGVDRVYVFSVADTGGRVLATQRHEWVAPDVESQLDDARFQGFDMAAEGFQRWVDELSLGATVSGRTAELPTPERTVLEALDIAAIAAVPVEVAGRWWGWLAFERTRAADGWSEVEIVTLQAAASVLGASVDRRELTTVLRAREAEAELAFQREREVAERLRALDELKDTFLTAVSHELRTPLTAIRGFAATLIDHHSDLDAFRQMKLLERLSANVERLDDLLRELLDLNRLSSGTIEAHPVVVDVDELVANALRRVVAGLGAHHVRVDVRVRTANLDPVLAGRVLDILLQNVGRHTPTGTSVEIRVEPGDGGVLFTVEDDGPGIAPEHRQAVFTAFHHGPTAPQHSPGTGVGLSLVARFAALHGGHAWVEESASGGACFHVLLRDTASGDEGRTRIGPALVG